MGGLIDYNKGGGGGDVTIGETPIINGTPGSILHIDQDGKINEDNANLFYDRTGKNIGLGTNVFGTNATKSIFFGVGQKSDNEAPRQLFADEKTLVFKPGFNNREMVMGLHRVDENTLYFKTDSLQSDYFADANGQFFQMHYRHVSGGNQQSGLYGYYEGFTANMTGGVGVSVFNTRVTNKGAVDVNSRDGNALNVYAAWDRFSTRIRRRGVYLGADDAVIPTNHNNNGITSAVTVDPTHTLVNHADVYVKNNLNGVASLTTRDGSGAISQIFKSTTVIPTMPFLATDAQIRETLRSLLEVLRDEFNLITYTS